MSNNTLANANTAGIDAVDPLLLSDFDLAKEKYDICDVATALTGLDVVQSGDYFRLEDGSCPICGHNDSFTLYPDGKKYHCYSASCEVPHGDVFDLIEAVGEASSAQEALELLTSGKLNVVERVIPRQRPASEPEFPHVTQERRQAVLTFAADYYQQRLTGAPLEQLLATRKHSLDIVQRLALGFSDGHLHRALSAAGFSEDEQLASGLVKKGEQRVRDSLPVGTFMFPHFDQEGRVSRFTCKDPSKEKKWQMRTAAWLNGVQFYGEDTLAEDGPVALVEGENDRIALLDAGWFGPVLATIGTLSKTQQAWLQEHLMERDVFTVFDTDEAGDGYRMKVQALGLTSLLHIKLPSSVKDIDEYLHSENPLPLEELIDEYLLDIEQPEADAQPLPSDAAMPDYLQPEIIKPQPIMSIEPTDFNDTRNAERLVALCGHDLKYVQGFDEFIHFNGNHWESTDAHTYTYAREVGESIIGISEDIIQRGVHEKNDNLVKFGNSAKNFAVKSMNRQNMNNLLEVSKPMLTIRSRLLNANPMLLGVDNGVIDLTTGTLMAPRRAHYITRTSSVVFDASATCPRWLQFIQEITCGDAELAEFLQRCVGYWLTGRTDEQLLFFLYGHGCNGKSTFMSILQELMGSYSHQIKSDVLLLNRFGANTGPNPSLTKLVGARLVVANELPEGAFMDENLVKSMTGDDVIVARGLYAKTEIEFRPTFSLVMIGNHKPVIRDTSPGMWRRMMLLPFNASFSGNQLDPMLMSTLKSELSGILNWALTGTQMWLRKNLKQHIPQVLQTDIQQYRDESDLLGCFLNERTVPHEGGWISTDALFDAFKEWASRDREWQMTRNIMTKKLVERGYQKGRKNNCAAIIGLCLQDSLQACNQGITPPVSDACELVV